MDADPRAQGVNFARRITIFRISAASGMVSSSIAGLESIGATPLAGNVRATDLFIRGALNRSTLDDVRKGRAGFEAIDLLWKAVDVARVGPEVKLNQFPAKCDAALRRKCDESARERRKIILREYRYCGPRPAI